MAAIPNGLGWCVHRRLEKNGISFLVDQTQIPESKTDEEFAITRDIRLHDINRTILGLPITVAGEAAALAFYASTRSAPTDIGILSSWMLHGAYEPSERRLIWDAIGFGVQLARSSLIFSCPAGRGLGKVDHRLAPRTGNQRGSENIAIPG